jgi:hypothetical protein
MAKEIKPDDDATAPQNPRAPNKPSHMWERHRIIEEYANALRDLLRKLRNKLN